MNEENSGAQENTAPPTPTVSHSHREQVIDRTGDLMREAHAISGEFQRATLAAVTEPDTGTDALVIVAPDGSIKPLPQSYFNDYRDAPKRRSGTAVMTRLESFVDHTNRFKTPASALFASDSKVKPSLTAVLDYHEPLRVDDGDERMVIPNALPDFCQHRAFFGFPLSDEWKAWKAMDGEWMSMAQFAVFLEERFIDVEQIEDPDSLNADIQQLRKALNTTLATPTKLLELSQELVVLENATHAQSQNRYTGESAIMVRNEHTDENGQKIELPKMFVINIPVFDRGDHWRIAARLRWSKSGGVKFIYDLWGIERVFETAISEVCNTAQTNTGLPLFYGAPEPTT